MLNGREPIVKGAPEILNKYVGQSEENVRNLFVEAEKEQAEKGDDSELHVIVLDEIDAICKARGSVQSGTGVNDSVVNQLLAKIDGVRDSSVARTHARTHSSTPSRLAVSGSHPRLRRQVQSLNNILIIGMTNRIDMIDEALLRPGRLEVHMEIPLPDKRGRFEIFRIHTAGMAKHNRLTPDVNLEELARLTKNFSGAEILGLTKSAQSFAMNRCLDPTNPTKVIKPEEAVVTQQDFLNALQEVKPAFGVVGEEFTNISGNGIIDYGPSFGKLLRAGQLFIQQVQTSNTTRHVSLLLEGKPGTGKSALAASFALHGNFPFVKLVSPENLVGYSESAKCSKIQSV